MHILSLRRKLGEDASGPGTITTVRGVGYRFEAD
jgi:DNA-binding response OmpR family regulator